MISPRFLSVFAVAFAALAAAFFAVTLVVDPFGVSPLSASMAQINRYKPARIDIDRYIKPYEVWRYQPKTVYLGTSRIQQGFDPAVASGSRFAPAYNASIPASTVELNAANLRQYVALDKNLKTVVLEVFFYQFIKSETASFLDRRTGVQSILQDGAQLFLSWNALAASFKTVAHNLGKDVPVQEIKPGGFFYYPPGHNSKGGFDGFPAGIWRLQDTRPSMEFDDSSFAAFDRIVDICRRNNLELIVILTPNHVYDDFFIDYIGAWDQVQAWLSRISAVAPVISFSQPGEVTDEPVALTMKYWNDPYHFKLDVGEMIQRSLLRQAVGGTTGDFKATLTPATVTAHVAARRAFVRAWMKDQQPFAASVAAEHRKWLASRHDAASVRH